jgi:hypothetical protein
MDPNSSQCLFGMAYIMKRQQALQPKAPFSEFDNLTPDEPSWVWQLVKRLLSIAGNNVTSRVFKHHQTFPRQISNPRQGDGQRMPFSGEIIVTK